MKRSRRKEKNTACHQKINPKKDDWLAKTFHPLPSQPATANPTTKSLRRRRTIKTLNMPRIKAIPRRQHLRTIPLTIGIRISSAALRITCFNLDRPRPTGERRGGSKVVACVVVSPGVRAEAGSFEVVPKGAEACEGAGRGDVSEGTGWIRWRRDFEAWEREGKR
jgi:hypothetical protein